MSKLITFLEAYEEAQSVLPYQNTNDKAEFAKLLNRAAKRLIARGPMPNLVSSVKLIVESDVVNDASIRLDLNLYESLLSVKNGCRVYDIIPVSSLYLDSKIGHNSFIDNGINTSVGFYRYYLSPPNESIEVGDELECLVKKSYDPVSDDNDLLPFDSVGAIKQAMIAVFYEDQGDATTAANYWQLAVNEATYDAREYRGSAYPVFSFRDPLFDQATKSVY